MADLRATDRLSDQVNNLTSVEESDLKNESPNGNQNDEANQIKVNY